MIKLKDILQEFEYGDKLMADPAYASSSGKWRSFMNRYYKDWEPDTDDEQKLFLAITDYLKSNVKSYLGRHRNVMKKLLALKQSGKFPHILDPLSAEDHVEGVYRGMSIPQSQLEDLIRSEKVKPYARQNWWEIPYNATISSRSMEAPILSVSSDPFKASNFALDNAKRGINADRYPIVAYSTYSKIADRAFMNPDFLDLFTSFNEKEYWLLDPSKGIPTSGILFPDIQYHPAAKLFADSNPELFDLIDRLAWTRPKL